MFPEFWIRMLLFCLTSIRYTMHDVAHTFKKGHRITVQEQSCWFLLFDRNPQQFVNIYTCKDQDFKKTTIRIYRDAGNASCIVLPALH